MDQLLKALNIDPMLLLLNGVLFLVLLAILNGIFWKPIMQHLEKRRHQIDDAYRTVDSTRREMESLRAEYQSRLAAIEAEARGRIQQTVRDAQDQRERIIAEARGQAEATVREGGVSIEAEMRQTLALMRGNLDAVAASTLSRATGMAADDAQKRLVDQFVAEHVSRQ